MSKELSYLLAALAAWRLTHLIAYEDGPFQIVARLRACVERFSAGLSCFYCLSVWVPLPFAFVLSDGTEWLLLWLGGSGAVMLLNKVAGTAPVIYWKEGERNDELLRKNEAP